MTVTPEQAKEFGVPPRFEFPDIDNSKPFWDAKSFQGLEVMEDPLVAAEIRAEFHALASKYGLAPV